MKAKWKSAFLAFSAVMLLGLAGCGETPAPEAVEATTILVEKNGAVTYYLVDDFDKDYYSVTELAAMVEAEAAGFNEREKAPGKEAPVTVEKVERLEQNVFRVLVVCRFNGYKSFNKFNEGSFFYGTVDEAVSGGYLRTALVRSVKKDGGAKTADQLKQDGSRKIIITNEKAIIRCPEKVSYLSDGAVLNEDGSVDASLAPGTVYILLK